MAPKIAIIYYSTYGHLYAAAQEVQKGVQSAGGSADLYQIKETLPEEVLKAMHAPPKSDVPLASVDTLKEYDAFLFGIPTRYGNVPAQWKAFWDQTGGLWAAGALYGKPFGVFVSTGGLGGGQEATIINSLSSFIHHGMVYVPLGYGEAFPLLTNLTEVHGGSPWGSGLLAGGDGSRKASELENKVFNIHGKTFYKTVEKF
ncbi:flavodoxin-like fold protein [Yamadazyma tenuis]|uniref:Flavo protein WrbA n=1 Tax=Candida tenuis (strain ATCC 10573 / BCRC 21748 / CBS 615 / JCM 9827 / NBRC 10315 / NRRL Y-1498 / VKM Y-70) TaxID=590646 RepID=G3B3Q9_CANTC|nr:flavo protein WrbA [Yamadazyma tenuis ATCC 10573]EGV64212.1 flavo protein WrbA [Yamadazyma tenuis ATCC 10573]WEJ96123.1 flavodoxin-like fold protein [Yamadazyma tenuis]